MPRALLQVLLATAVGALVVALPTSAAETSNAYPSETLNLSVPDNSATHLATDITVPDEGQIADVDVSVIVDEPPDGNLADLDLLLSHSGKTVELSTDNGSVGTDYGSGTCDTGTFATFDDEATASIASAPAPFEGSFKPEQPLAAFDGAPTDGTWTLQITDDFAGGGQATLVCWKVTITFAESDLSVTLADSPDPVAPGGSVTYTASVTNKGPSVSKGTILTLTLPSGATVSSATPSKGTCGAQTPLTCDLGDLAKDEKVDVAVVATLAQAGTATAKATVDGDAGDPIEGDNSAETTTLVQEGAAQGSEAVTVTKTGTGSGTVTSSPAGISCGLDCEGGFAPGTEVTLAATPAAGSTFEGWGGACQDAPADGPCVLTAGGDLAVTAAFGETSSGTGGAGAGSGGKGSSTYYRCTITGTAKADVLRGTPRRDVICGLGGSDKLYGLGGNDILIGGPGKDVLYGGKGNDIFFTRDRSRDRVFGGPGRDRIRMDVRDSISGIEDSL